MTKKLILFACVSFLFAANRVRGQSAGLLTEFNEREQRSTRAGMLTLGGWAVSNVAVSGLSLSTAEGSRYHFHQMNIFWNAVNITLAGIGYYRAARKDVSQLSLVQTIKDHHSLRRKLLFNAGLDGAYLVGGLYLLQRAKNEPSKAARWRGYGQSVVLQGAFLLVFDAAFYAVVRTQAKPLDILIKKLTVSHQGIGIIHQF